MSLEKIFRKIFGKKVAVILHGYPSPIQKEMPLWRILEEMGYEVIMPKYLESKENFTINWVIEETERLLRGRKPNLLIGISLGGIMLPYLASRYPKAKVVFAATGARLKSKMKWFDWTVDMFSKKHGIHAARLLSRIPEKAMAIGYDFVHKPTNVMDKTVCELDKQTIIKVLKTTDPSKHIEIARFAKMADSRQMLKNMGNSAFVCIGSQDELMPPEMGEELASLVKNSRVLKVEAQHFNVLNSISLAEIKKFIKE